MTMDIEGLLKCATKGIAAEWFSITNSDENNKLKERVYCYELYHQLRLLACGNKLLWQCEIDKSGRTKFKREKPDFLLHVPNSEVNHLVMEVKTSDSRFEGWKKDVETLIRFLDEHDYKKAYFLIFGSKDPSRRLKKLGDNSSGEAKASVSKIEVWWHKNPKEEATKLPNPWGYGATSR